MKKVILGGTFDILHKGHEALLKKAFELGKVVIGLTSDKFAQKLKKREITPFEERKKNLENFIRKNYAKKAKIVKIDDVFGPALRENFDFIVVSKKTFKEAQKINQRRKKLGKKQLKIVRIDMVLGENGKPISGTRIKNGEIDAKGRECAFCKIVKGKVKALKIFENKKFLAFLDKKPRNLGHTLLIPKKHYRWIWDVPEIEDYFKAAKKIVKALRRAFNTDWVISLVLGDEVKHAHLHLIPRFKGDDFVNIPPPVKKIPQKEMEKIQRKIKRNLKKT
jgi:pantetheine-phosphate adenylyltransferase